ncbi:MAG: hypothetical protein WBZ42_10890 [Halobacteriota archaeon]
MLADTGAGRLLALGVGLIFVAVLLLIIILIEALILRGLKWESFTHSFIDSLMINLISAAFGVVFLFVGAPLSATGLERPSSSFLFSPSSLKGEC